MYRMLENFQQIPTIIPVIIGATILAGQVVGSFLDPGTGDDPAVDWPEYNDATNGSRVASRATNRHNLTITVDNKTIDRETEILHERIRNRRRALVQGPAKWESQYGESSEVEDKAPTPPKIQWYSGMTRQWSSTGDMATGNEGTEQLSSVRSVGSELDSASSSDPITEYVLINELDQHLFQSTTPPPPVLFGKFATPPPAINIRTNA